jgi:hypothetical protein
VPVKRREDAFCLGAWVGRQRLRYRQGVLTQEPMPLTQDSSGTTRKPDSGLVRLPTTGLFREASLVEVGRRIPNALGRWRTVIWLLWPGQRTRRRLCSPCGMPASRTRRGSHRGLDALPVCPPRSEKLQAAAGRQPWGPSSGIVPAHDGVDRDRLGPARQHKGEQHILTDPWNGVDGHVGAA